MKPSDFVDFTGVLQRTMSIYNRRNLSETDVGTWFTLLSPYELEDISKAFLQHMVDPKRGKEAPVPADIVQHLREKEPTGISPSIAWAIALEAQDHWKTVAWTRGMKNAWGVAEPIYSIGDHFAARKAFIDAYLMGSRMAGMDEWLLSCGNVAPSQALAERTKAIEEGLRKGYYGDDVAKDLHRRYCQSLEKPKDDSQELTDEEIAANIQRLREIIGDTRKRVKVNT